MDRKTERVIEAEKEIYDLIPRLKGIHGRCITEYNYEAWRNLSLAASRIASACHRIMDTFENVNPDIREYDRNN